MNSGIMLILCRLNELGIPCPVVAMGATPTCSKPDEKMKMVTELHPGNYIFYGRYLCRQGPVHKVKLNRNELGDKFRQ